MSLSVEQLLRQQYNPALGIVVYVAEDSRDDENKYYLESHSIGKDGQFEEGKPLKTETIAAIGQVFRDKTQQETIITGAIPTCLLHYVPARGGDYTLVWFRPTMQRVLHFVPELKIKSGLATVPPMLFMAKHESLSVWALPNSKRPTPKTKVIRAPFHNVGGGGGVCLGSAKVRLPQVKTFENMIEYWEQLFWASKFSHGMSDVKGGLAKLWKRQIADPEKPFPMELLPESKTTYQSIINARG